MSTVARYIKQSQDISFLSDGDRRYGNRLFDLCSEQLRNDKQNRSPKTLPEGVRVRIKNKGSQNTASKIDGLSMKFLGVNTLTRNKR